MTVETYSAAFDASWTDDTPPRHVRFVVLDTETTGFDPQRDRLITIGAVGVQDGEILLDDACELMLKLSHNLASVTVHGITRDQARDGMEELEALEIFLGYLQDAVIVGHHIGHDIQFLNSACERHFGFKLKNRFLDTMDLTLRLNDEGAFADQTLPGRVFVGRTLPVIQCGAPRPPHSRRRRLPDRADFSSPVPYCECQRTWLPRFVLRSIRIEISIAIAYRQSSRIR